MTEVVNTIWGGGTVTTTTQVTDVGSYTFGNQFSLSQQARLTGIWFYSPQALGTLPAAATVPTSCGIYRAADPSAGQGQLLVQNSAPTWSGAAGSGWIKCTFDGGVTLFPSINYKVCVQTNGGTSFYTATSNYWSSGPGASGITTGIITAPNNASADGGQSTYTTPSTGSVLTYPDTANSAENLWVDVEVTTGIPAPNPPVQGFALKSPRTWSTEDLVTTTRLRADMYNLSGLMTQGRPIFQGTNPNYRTSQNAKVFASNVVPILNTWDTVLTQTTGTAQFYQVPLTGWYLLQGWAGQSPVSGGAASTSYKWGMGWNQGAPGTTTTTDLGQCGATSTGSVGTASLGVGTSGAELALLSFDSGDFVGAYATTSASGGSNVNMKWGVEWVGVPSSGTVNGVAYAGMTGTVVASPKPASLWPAGPGATLSGSASATGTVLAMTPYPGVRAGAVIGLDWQYSQKAQSYAETVTIASVQGGTITTSSPLLYGHSSGAPVAVPVSAAFLNEQMRDQVNFMTYPPLLRAVQGTAHAQAVQSSTWTTLTLATSGTDFPGGTIDNFNGFAGSAYTIPVSGMYLVSGQVYFAGSSATTNWGAALIDNNGVRYQGDFYSTAGSSNQAPAVRRMLRLTAGQTISLQAWQSSGGSLNTAPSITVSTNALVVNLPRLIVVWRSF